MDGCAVNRKLIKIHQRSSGLIHKVLNPFAKDGRHIHFFSDPPHLLKTVRNCLASKCRDLWVWCYSIVLVTHMKFLACPLSVKGSH